MQRLTIPTSCPVSFAELMRKCWQADPKVRSKRIERIRFRQIKIHPKTFKVNIKPQKICAALIWSRHRSLGLMPTVFCHDLPVEFAFTQ